MAFKLEKPAEGLLGALNLKTAGQSPPGFAETLVPTYPARDYYLSRQVTSFTSATAPGALAAFTTVTLTVPAGKCWHVYQVGAVLGTGVVAANTILDFVSFFRRAQQPTPVALGEFRMDTASFPSLVGAATFLNLAQTFESPLILYGGDRINTYNQIAVAAVGATLRITAAVCETDF